MAKQPAPAEPNHIKLLVSRKNDLDLSLTKLCLFLDMGDLTATTTMMRTLLRQERQLMTQLSMILAFQIEEARREVHT